MESGGDRVRPVKVGDPGVVANPWSAELICKKHCNQRVFFNLKSS